MKNLALVAILFSVVSLPAFAQNKYIKQANTNVVTTEASAPAQVEKSKLAAPEKLADESEAATDAGATRDADATPDADAATDETATDTAAPTATDAAEGLEKREVEQ